jgi:NitT/TauT family transport system substrate-binding protein
MRRLSITHGLALSNLPVFVAKEHGLFAREGLGVETLSPRSVDELSGFLAAGAAEVASCAFTTIMALQDEGVPLVIIGGAGVLGLAVLAQPHIAAWGDLKGRRIGTLRRDALEILLYEGVVANGLSYGGLQVEYCAKPSELSESFTSHRYDAVTHLEPYATQLRTRDGARVLTDGRDLWGCKYPDCVIAARQETLERSRTSLEAFLRALLRAQAAIETDFTAACRDVVGKYFSTPFETILAAASSMPPGVDIRDQTKVILGRAAAMQALGYLRKAPSEDLFEFSPLESVIVEEHKLWAGLRIRSEGLDPGATTAG